MARIIKPGTVVLSPSELASALKDSDALVTYARIDRKHFSLAAVVEAEFPQQKCGEPAECFENRKARMGPKRAMKIRDFAWSLYRSGVVTLTQKFTEDEIHYLAARV